MEKSRGLEDRLIDFGNMILGLIESMPRTMAARTIGEQLIRSGTAIGANYEEASAAESKADFIHKLQVALKESRETCYWLRLLARRSLIASTTIDSVINESLQIRAMLSKSVATAKSKL